MTSDAALGAVPALPTTNITFIGNGGLRFDADFTTTPLNSNRSITTNSGAEGALNIQSFNVNYGGIISGPGNIQEVGTGTLKLGGASTFSGTATADGGTLELDGNTGQFSNTVPLSVEYGGAFAYVGKATGSSQALGALSFVTGDGTVQLTYGASGNTSLSFSSFTRSVGATGTFNVVGGTNGTTNKITIARIPADSLVDPGAYVATASGSMYAWNDAAGFVRAINYAGDAGAVSSPGGTSVSGTNVQTTGPITAQPTSTFTTLNISGANDFNLASGATLTVSSILKTGNNGAVLSGGAALQAPLNGELLIRNDQPGDALSINTPIVANGVNPLTIDGPGVVVLNAANTYAGKTIVTGGQLQLGNALAVQNCVVQVNYGSRGLAFSPGIGTFSVGGISGSTNVDLTDTAGGPVYLQLTGGYPPQFSGAGGLVKVGTGTLNLFGPNTFNGGIEIDGGTVAIINDASFGTPPAAPRTNVTFGGNATLQLYDMSTTLNSNRSIVIGSGNTATFDTQQYSAICGGTISGGGALTKLGTGTLTLTGANTYGGGTTIGSATTIPGTLNINSDAALGAVPASPAANIVFPRGGTLQFAGPVVLNSNRSIAIAPNASVNFDTQSFDVTIGGSINGPGGGFYPIYKIGSGTLTLTGDNSAFGGSTFVSAGTLLATHPASVPGYPNSQNTVSTGATLAVQAGGSGEWDATSLAGLRTKILFDSSSNLGISVVGTNSFSYAGDLGGGGIGLVKIGSGTLTLSGANSSFGSTTVGAGTLQVTRLLAPNGSTTTFISAGTDFTTASLVRRVQPGGSYAGFGSSAIGSALGLLGSNADIRAGRDNNAAFNDVAMQWRVSNANDSPRLVSDVLNLTGMSSSVGGHVQTDPFALQMSYSIATLGGRESMLASQGLIDLAWLNLSMNEPNGLWQNATTGNFGTGLPGDVFQNVQSSWDAFAAAHSVTDANVGNFLGSYGVDTGSHTAWAVVNHNSQFSVVPEPSTLVLLAIGICGLAGLAIRGQRSPICGTS